MKGMKKNVSSPKKEGERSFDWIPVLNYLSLAILVMGLLIWILSITWSKFSILSISVDPNTPFLLSAIAQSLAAVLALVFTATLIVAQLSSRYSHRVLTYFFDAYTISYILLFVIAVVLPILLLTNMYLVAIKASLILGTVCLVLLVPYFYRFRIMLTPEYLLTCTTNRALSRLRSNTAVEPQDLATLDNIVMSAYDMRDYETFGKGIRCLVALFYEILKIEWRSPKTGKEITHDELREVRPFEPGYERLFGLAPSVSPTRHALEMRIYNIAQAVSKDPIAPEQIIKALEFEAKDAIKEGRSFAAEIIMLLIQQIAEHATSKGSESYGYAAIESFEDVGLEALAAGQTEIVNLALFQLSWIGVQAHNARLSEIVKKVVYFIERIGREAGWKKILACASEAASRLFFLFGMAGLGDHSIPLFDSNQQPYNLSDEISKSLRSIESASQTDVINTAFQKAIELQDWVVGSGAKDVGVKYCKMVENIYEGLSKHQ